MAIFRTKARSAESYLAGIGASGALLGSAFVIFVIFIGVVTFIAWPQAGTLLGDGGGGAVLHSSATPAAAPAANPGVASLVARLGGGRGAATPRGGARAGAPNGNGHLPAGDGGLPGGPGVGSPGGAGVTPPGSTGSRPAPSPPPPAGDQPRNAVSQTVSNVGNAVQTTTVGLGDALGGSASPGLGGVVGGVGKALNDQLQSFAGAG